MTVLQITIVGWIFVLLTIFVSEYVFGLIVCPKRVMYWGVDCVYCLLLVLAGKIYVSCGLISSVHVL